ncbi:MAG: PhzF family phenazine biosynthesis protein [Patescibacteria group bacterium]|mgnify:CR=1 FL=1
MANHLNIHTLRVFVNQVGKFGNSVGIIQDEGKKIVLNDRQRIATDLGYSESVFINDVSVGSVSIFNPRSEVPFAGHAMVGAAWFMNKTGDKPIDSLVCEGGTIKTWMDDGKTWIRAALTTLPAWKYVQRKNPIEVERLSESETKTIKHSLIWAWIDEHRGLIRARTFAPDWGIPEDEANGSGSMRLAAILGRTIEIFHGKGSIIYAKPLQSDFADLGGRVIED